MKRPVLGKVLRGLPLGQVSNLLTIFGPPDALGLLASILRGFFGLCWIVCLVSALFYGPVQEWAGWGVLASLPFWLFNRWLPGDWRP